MTQRLMVVADDLTGANAVAALLRRNGRCPFVLRRVGEISVDQLPRRCDVVIINAHTRDFIAADMLTELAAIDQWLVGAHGQGLVTAVRIDSTLRGQIGATAAWVLRRTIASSGRHAVGFCVPAYPAAGRTTRYGRQFVHSVALHLTDLGDHCRWSPPAAEVRRLFTGHGLRVESLTVAEVDALGRGPDASITETVAATDVLVVDAESDDHVEAAARLAERVWAAGTPVVAIDPGPFTAAFDRRCASAIKESAAGPSVLALVGSPSALTTRQIIHAQRYEETVVVEIPPQELLTDLDMAFMRVEDTWVRAVSAHYIIVTIARTNESQGRAVLHDLAGLSHAVAEVGRRLLERFVVDGMFCSGGDTADAFLSRIGAHGLEVSGEVEPLAVSGVIRGGAGDGLPIVTKGGMVGDVTTLQKCLRSLSQDIANESRHARTGAPLGATAAPATQEE